MKHVHYSFIHYFSSNIPKWSQAKLIDKACIIDLLICGIRSSLVSGSWKNWCTLMDFHEIRNTAINSIDLHRFNKWTSPWSDYVSACHAICASFKFLWMYQIMRLINSDWNQFMHVERVNGFLYLSVWNAWHFLIRCRWVSFVC